MSGMSCLLSVEVWCDLTFTFWTPNGLNKFELFAVNTFQGKARWNCVAVIKTRNWSTNDTSIVAVSFFFLLLFFNLLNLIAACTADMLLHFILFSLHNTNSTPCHSFCCPWHIRHHIASVNCFVFTAWEMWDIVWPCTPSCLLPSLAMKMSSPFLLPLMLNMVSNKHVTFSSNLTI